MTGLYTPFFSLEKCLDEGAGVGPLPQDRAHAARPAEDSLDGAPDGILTDL